MTLLGAVIVMGLVTYLVRAIPLVVMRRPITNKWVLSFLYYVPFAVLVAMTIPDILTSTGSVISGIAALVVAVLLALFGRSLMTVALGAALAVLVTQLLLGMAG